METELRILIVEDSAADAALCERALQQDGLTFKMLHVETREAYERALAQFKPDLVLSDFSMPTFDGPTALDLARQRLGDIPFIFVSSTIGEDRAVEAMRWGANDYVLKDQLQRLVPVVNRAVKEAKERALRGETERALRESQERFRALLEAAPDAIVLVDHTGKMVLVNARMEHVFGHAREELVGNSVDILVPEHQRLDHPGHRSRYLANPQVRTMAARTSLQGRRKDGSLVPLEISLSPIEIEEKTHVIGIIRDVTERREQELKIARLSRIHAVLSGINSAIVRIRDRRELLQEACRIAVEHGHFGIAWIGMLDPKTLELNPVACAGVEPESFLAVTPNTARADLPLGGGIVGRAIRERRHVFSNDLLSEPSAGAERRKEALRRGYRSLISLPLFVENAVVGALSLFAMEPGFFSAEELKLLNELAGDISFALDHIAKEEKLTYLAYYDALTGLPNRTHFNERVSQLIHASGPEHLGIAVMVLDPERFRNINETLGIATGDEILKRIAERLSKAIGDRGTVARISGDQFAAALGGVRNEADVAHLLEQHIFVALTEPFSAAAQELRIAVKAGIAMYPTDGNEAELLFVNANAALAKAKQSGEHFLFYAAEMNARVADRLKVENELRRAVLEEQFVLYYQPRIDLGTGQISGFEALIRWQHPERGLVPPGEFISILEDTGLIFEVSRWALKRATRDHAELRAQGLKGLRIAVNISAIDLRRKDFVENVKAALSTADGSGGYIDIELTESMLMEDVEGNIAKLKALQAMGLKVAIDDFGTGYCSMSYLARLPIDSLKVDRSFVSQMAKGPEQMAIVSTVISLARALNLQVVAEGVETEEQANLLRLLHCDEAQGYLFGRPEPLNQVKRLIK